MTDSTLTILMPASMPIKNDEGQTIGQGVIDMHGFVRVTLDDSEEATEFLQLAKLSDRFDVKFNLMLQWAPVPAYQKGVLRDV